MSPLARCRPLSNNAMRLIEADLIRWRKRKWLWFLLLVVAIHVAAIAWFSARGPLPQAKYPSSPSVTMVTGESVSPELAGALDEYEDPTLFASAHLHGFSSLVWLGKPLHDYDILGPAQPPRLLAFNEALEIQARARSDKQRPSIFRSVKKYSVPLEKPELIGSARPPRSELRIQGLLAKRTLLKEPVLPPEYFNDALANTIIEAGVDRDGLVLSARLLSSSGFKQADQDALSIVKKLRFSPEDQNSGAGLTWGRLIFDWFGLELASTNAPAKR
jgi:TonB family protein